MKTRLITLLMIASVFYAIPAFALDLHQARASGKIGEKADGYVAAIDTSSEVKALVSDVNAKRKAEYTRISKENGQSVEVVAKLAAGQIVAKLGSGEMYQDANGNWKKK